MLKHVFIVNTPLHLLIAQSIINEQQLNNCFLVCYTKDRLTCSKLLDSTLWQQIYELPNIKKFKAYQFKRKVKFLHSLNSASLFWGNDYQLENQVVADIISPKEIFLVDDGIASYIDNIHKVSFHKRVAMLLYSYVFLGGALKNRTGIGFYRFNGRYCLNKELIKNGPVAKDIKLSFSKMVVDEVNTIFTEEKIIHPAGIILTQPISEYNALTCDEENEHLIKLVRHANKVGITTLVVKSHPAETELRSKERLNLINTYSNAPVLVLPRLNNLPIEVITSGASYRQFECALSIYSTALLTLKLLQSDLCCISSLTKNDAKKSKAFSQLYMMFKKFKIQEVNSERVL